MASPSFSRSSLFHVDPLVTAVGKHVVLTEPLIPSMSDVKVCFLSPWGPSDIIMAGMPYFLKAFVCQKSAPLQRAILSLSDMDFMIAEILSFMFLPSNQKSNFKSG